MSCFKKRICFYLCVLLSVICIGLFVVNETKGKVSAEETAVFQMDDGVSYRNCWSEAHCGLTYSATINKTYYDIFSSGKTNVTVNLLIVPYEYVTGLGASTVAKFATAKSYINNGQYAEGFAEAKTQGAKFWYGIVDDITNGDPIAEDVVLKGGLKGIQTENANRRYFGIYYIEGKTSSGETVREYASFPTRTSDTASTTNTVKAGRTSNSLAYVVSSLSLENRNEWETQNMTTFLRRSVEGALKASVSSEDIAKIDLEKFNTKTVNEVVKAEIEDITYGDDLFGVRLYGALVESDGMSTLKEVTGNLDFNLKWDFDELSGVTLTNSAKQEIEVEEVKSEEYTSATVTIGGLNTTVNFTVKPLVLGNSNTGLSVGNYSVNRASEISSLGVTATLTLSPSEKVTREKTYTFTPSFSGSGFGQYSATVLGSGNFSGSISSLFNISQNQYVYYVNGGANVKNSMTNSAGQIICKLSFRNYYKHTDEFAFVGTAYILNDDYPNYPILVGKTKTSVQYLSDHNGYVFPYGGMFDYLGETWYYSAKGHGLEHDYSDESGNGRTRYVGTSIEDCCRQMLQANLNTVVYDDQISDTFSAINNSTGLTFSGIYSAPSGGEKVESCAFVSPLTELYANWTGNVTSTASVDYNVLQVNYAGTTNDVDCSTKTYYVNGDFQNVSVTSIKRTGPNKAIADWDNTVQNDYCYDSSAGYLKTSYVTLTKNGIYFADTVTNSLVNQCYDTQTLDITFSNGTVLTFTLNSTTIYFSNYDETSIYYEDTNKDIYSRAYQDNYMVSLADYNGGKALKYTPGDAQRACTNNWSNGSDNDNKVLTFINTSLSNEWEWWDIAMGSSGTLFVVFDYYAHNDSNFVFQYWYLNEGKQPDIALNGTSTFYLKLDLSKLKAFAIGYKGTTKPDTSHYLLIDNFGFGICDTARVDTIELSVEYGQEAFNVWGNYNGVTVTSIKRTGTNYWDNTVQNGEERDNYDANKGYMSLNCIDIITNNYIKLNSSLVNQIYGTETFTITFSSGQTGTFSVTSNTMFYTNYDETYINWEPDGNTRSCQDTAMREMVDYNGGKALKYIPGRAVQSHAVNWANGAGNDNKIMTFSNNAVNHWWWEFDFPSSGTVFITFDYETTATGFTFQYWDASGTQHVVNLSNGKGSFYQEIPVTSQGFAIGYAGTSKPAESVYMIIDNYGFGTKI